MLGIVDGQLVDFQPVVAPRDLTVTLGHDRIQAFAGGEPIVTGVNYFVMNEDPGLDVTLNRATGEITEIKGYGVARLRAVMGNGHVDVEMKVQRREPDVPEIA